MICENDLLTFSFLVWSVGAGILAIAVSTVILAWKD